MFPGERIGDVLELYWGCIGAVLGMHWRGIGCNPPLVVSISLPFEKYWSAATIGSSALLSLSAFSATRKLRLLRLEDDDESDEDDEFKSGAIGGVSVAAIVTLLR